MGAQQQGEAHQHCTGCKPPGAGGQHALRGSAQGHSVQSYSDGPPLLAHFTLLRVCVCVCVQVPKSFLSPHQLHRGELNTSNEVAIRVIHRQRGTDSVWTLDTLEEKVLTMREMYQRMEDGGTLLVGLCVCVCVCVVLVPALRTRRWAQTRSTTWNSMLCWAWPTSSWTASITTYHTSTRLLSLLRQARWVVPPPFSPHPPPPPQVCGRLKVAVQKVASCKWPFVLTL